MMPDHSLCFKLFYHRAKSIKNKVKAKSICGNKMEVYLKDIALYFFERKSPF
jgi:hypothetical protein